MRAFLSLVTLSLLLTACSAPGLPPSTPTVISSPTSQAATETSTPTEGAPATAVAEVENKTINPEDVFDTGTLSNFKKHNLVFYDKDGKTLFVEVNPETNEVVQEVGYLDKDGLHVSKTAFGLDANGKEFLEVKKPEENAFIVDKNKTAEKVTFVNIETKNQLFKEGMLTLTEKDGTTYIWDTDHKSFVKKPEMIADTDFSKIDQHPFIAEGYERVGIESALIWFAGHPPFNDEAVQNYIKSGGNSLLFEYLEGYGKRVSLKSKGDDNLNLTQDNATMKNSPLWVKMNINGVMQDINLIVNLDGPTPDEYKVFFGVSGVILKNLSPANKQERIDVLSGKVKPGPVYLFLFGDADYQKYDDLLAKLLALQGNDPMKFELFLHPKNEAEKAGWGIGLKEMEWKFGDGEHLPPEIQLMLLRSP